MVELRYSSGKIVSPKVHTVGVLALGSHLENHGAALPIDTDSKIASHLALQAALKTGAKYLGILYTATEYDYVQHGTHVTIKILVENNLKPTLQNAQKYLEIEKIVLVNAHGGNYPVKNYLKQLGRELNLEIVFNNKIVEIEGAHAGTGELSIGAMLGIVDADRLNEHCNFEEYPEVGMVGLKEAREASEGINRDAQEMESTGACVDLEQGEYLLEIAIEDIIGDIIKLID
ncbi:MAG: 2-amino-5-formylamino-6-ribosylaminopyrimidin-4(3H)-one 5'-monophosphate deformylase [Methanobacterium sp.]